MYGQEVECKHVWCAEGQRDVLEEIAEGQRDRAGQK